MPASDRPPGEGLATGRKAAAAAAGRKAAAARHVRIVLASRDGARHLAGQLDSLAAQSHGAWSLAVSDDGSTDGTREIVARFAAARPGQVHLAEGLRRGAAVNFLTALGAVPPGLWVALSDQDDIWMPHRLERALALLGDAPGPAAYASRTLLCDAAGRPLGPSPLPRRGPGFGNALVQNVLAGNTLVLNPEAADLVRRALPTALAAREGRGVGHHDWWIYALLAGAGARVVLDGRPGLAYRQHDGNLMGAHRGARAMRARAGMIRDGRYGDWIAGNLEALAAVPDLLTAGARDLAAGFRAWLDGAGPPLSALRRAGLRRQGRLEDLALGPVLRLVRRQRAVRRGHRQAP